MDTLKRVTYLLVSAASGVYLLDTLVQIAQALPR
jgi:hypothetical protein